MGRTLFQGIQPRDGEYGMNVKEQFMTNRNSHQQLQPDRVRTTSGNGATTKRTNGDQHQIEDRYNSHDASFRRHYQLTYHDKPLDSSRDNPRITPRTYEEFYAPAYRYGFELAEESPTADWKDVEAEAQRHWQSNHTGAWEEVVDAVHYGWKEQRNPEALRVHHYGEFDEYHKGFQRHYLDAMANSGSPFEHYEPAYRYGYDLAIAPGYGTYLWPEIEPEVRQYYETEYADGHLPWEHYRNAVRHAWQSVRSTKS
jgi:hypothetical protein